MSNSRKSVALGILIGLSVIVPVVAAPVTPYELVRTLQRVQDRVATGSVRAHHAQRKLLKHIAKRFRKADPAVWRARRNLYAMATFVLSGGDPSIARTVYQAGIEDETLRSLISAVLAYSEGRQSAAKRLFEAIDPVELPPTLGGHVALVKSALYQGSDAKRTLANLELARLLLPGTLIEETALRRAVVAAGNGNQLQHFEVFAGQYLRRFKRSVYGGEFDAKFSQQLIRLPYLEQPEQLSRLKELVSQLVPRRRLALYLSIARNAVVAGELEIALFAVEQAAELAKSDSTAFLRTRVYKAAAMVTTDPRSARAQLLELQTAALGEEDRQIFEAVLSITKNLLMVPGSQTGAESESFTQDMETASDGNAPSGVAAKAEELLKKVDKMLSESKP